MSRVSLGSRLGFGCAARQGRSARALQVGRRPWSQRMACPEPRSWCLGTNFPPLWMCIGQLWIELISFFRQLIDANSASTEGKSPARLFPIRDEHVRPPVGATGWDATSPATATCRRDAHLRRHRHRFQITERGRGRHRPSSDLLPQPRRRPGCPRRQGLHAPAQCRAVRCVHFSPLQSLRFLGIN